MWGRTEKNSSVFFHYDNIDGLSLLCGVFFQLLQRSSTRTVQPAVLVLPNQMPPRHVPLRSSVSLPPFPFPSPMSTISHPAGSPPLPVVLSASPPPPSYEEVVTSSNAYPQHSPPPIDGVRSKRLKVLYIILN